MSKIIQILLMATFRKPAFLIGLVSLGIFLCIGRISDKRRMKHPQA